MPRILGRIRSQARAPLDRQRDRYYVFWVGAIGAGHAGSGSRPPDRYAVITPVRDERDSIGRLRSALEAQTIRPSAWHIVDTGSGDGTLELASSFAQQLSWIECHSIDGGASRRRGGPVVDALEQGLREIGDSQVGIVVKVDADVTMGATYFASILAAFEADPRLGMASGRRLEPHGGGWKLMRLTRGCVEAQCRAYRRQCLEGLLPLERSLGWDGIDEVKAALAGWRTRVLDELRFVHHRPIGSRERSRRQAWGQAGHAARYMGYRPSYVLFRAAHHVFHGDASAVALVGAYVAASVRRAPQCPDPQVRSVLRQKQALRNLPARAREVSDRTSLAAPKRRVDLLLVADPGGHLSELVALRDVWTRFSRAWVTVAGVDIDAVPTGEEVFYGRGPTQRSLPNLIRNTLLAVRVLRRLRPAVVLTTGSGLAVPFAWTARLFGARVVYIECSGRIGVSLSGRLIGPITCRFYAQWPEVASRYGRARYSGTIFFSTR